MSIPDIIRLFDRQRQAIMVGRTFPRYQNVLGYVGPFFMAMSGAVVRFVLGKVSDLPLIQEFNTLNIYVCFKFVLALLCFGGVVRHLHGFWNTTCSVFIFLYVLFFVEK